MKKLIGVIFLVLVPGMCLAQPLKSDAAKEQDIIRKCLGLGHWSMVQCVELERKREMGEQAQPAVPVRPAPRALEESAKDKNPVPANRASIENGKTVYQQYCFTCHGGSGKGNGPASEFFQKPVPDLSNNYTQKKSDGALFWKITEGNVPMPVFGDFLTKEDIWDLVNYIRSLSAQQ